MATTPPPDVSPRAPAPPKLPGYSRRRVLQLSKLPPWVHFPETGSREAEPRGGAGMGMGRRSGHDAVPTRGQSTTRHGGNEYTSTMGPVGGDAVPTDESQEAACYCSERVKLYNTSKGRSPLRLTAARSRTSPSTTRRFDQTWVMATLVRMPKHTETQVLQFHCRTSPGISGGWCSKQGSGN